MRPPRFRFRRRRHRRPVVLMQPCTVVYRIMFEIVGELFRRYRKNFRCFLLFFFFRQFNLRPLPLQTRVRRFLRRRGCVEVDFSANVYSFFVPVN